MANRFRKRSQADADLDSIWSYIAADSTKAADHLIDRIGGVFEMLIQNPLVNDRNLLTDCAALPLPTTSYFTSRDQTALKLYVS
jgi:plasmid stabilization system protein ParE